MGPTHRLVEEFKAQAIYVTQVDGIVILDVSPYRGLPQYCCDKSEQQRLWSAIDADAKELKGRHIHCPPRLQPLFDLRQPAPLKLEDAVVCRRQEP